MLSAGKQCTKLTRLKTAEMLLASAAAAAAVNVDLLIACLA